jgi:ATP-binding cassette, subfamily B, bacterial CvaB/MchF/RaxB
VGDYEAWRVMKLVGLNFSLPSVFVPRFGWWRVVPLHLQMQSSECGLACLAMVAGYYGNEIGLGGLRQQFDVSTHGASLHEITEHAQALGLQATAIEATAEELSLLTLPAILHWDGGHFVVLEKVTAGGIRIADPAQGKRWVSLGELAHRFTGFTLQLVPKPVFKKQAPQAALDVLALLRTLPGLSNAILKLIALSVLLEAIALLTPYYMQLVIDHVVVTADLELLQILALAFALLLGFQTVFTGLRTWAGVLLSQGVAHQLFAHVSNHMLSLPIAFFIKRQIGDLTSRFESLEQVCNSLTRSTIDVVLDAAIGLGTLGMMFLFNTKLALMALCGFFVMMVLKVLVFLSSQRISAEKVFLDAKRGSHLIETLRGVHAIKMGQAEALRSREWMGLTSKIFQRGAALERINLFSNLSLIAVSGLTHCLVIYFASLDILTNVFSLGMMFAFLAYESSFISRTSAFVDKLLWFRMMRIHFGRVGDIVFEAPENKESIKDLTVESKVSAHSISYRYSQADTFIFQNIDVSFNNQKLSAIVGRSGCGKTTLLGVLSGLLLTSSGQLRVGDNLISAATALALRKNVAMVLQLDELFEGTIEGNICFFEESPDVEWVQKCAELACVHGEIMQWPLKYKSKLLENGMGLSGGQRQRILLARALYRKPKILILDEATSQLDVETEQRLIGNLKSLNLTIIMTAHRPHAIALADHVYSLEQKKWER